MLGSTAIWALGAMSGTSLDGVDAAMVLTDGDRVLEFGDTAFRAYTQDERAILHAALGQWPGDAGVAAAGEVVETAHAVLLSGFEGAGLVGFHGQTLAHDPHGRGTHQVGDGQVLAEILGLPVVHDFRSADVAMGGEGAPLAPFFHFALAKWMGAQDPIVILNLGGVGNLTWIDPSADKPEDDGALLAFDTGPANAPLNDLMQARRGLALDQDGALAASGQVAAEVVDDFLQDRFFNRMAPKSLDRDAFAGLGDAVGDLSDADAAATLVACSVAAVKNGLALCPRPPARVLVTGGGRHNGAMMAGLKHALPMAVDPVEAVGLNGDMLEAQAFAFLAVRVARGLPTSAPGTTGVSAAIGGGVISRPQG